MKQDFSREEKAELRSWAQGKAKGKYRRTCPHCSPTRRNQKDECLSVRIESEHMLLSCHHCETSGATKLVEEAKFIPPQFEKPAGKAVKRRDVTAGKEALEFLNSRGISPKTAQAFSLIQARAYFIRIKRETEAIAYPYFVQGHPYGHKFRSLEEKDHVCDLALGSLFGIQNVDMSESDDLIICEGEIDALSYYESGIPNSTSVPNGSGSFSNYNDDGTMRQQLGFLWEAREQIASAKRILISSDADAPGEKLAEELARRIGRHRCWVIKYPQDCKDANDVLLKHGPDKLAECVSEATPWPVEGLYEASKYFPEVDELYDNGFGEKIGTGLSAVDEIFSVGPGLLTVVTGVPGNGKSTFIDQILVNLARTRGYISALCSFENPPPVHIGKLMQMLYQKHFFETDKPGKRMTRQEVDAIKPFIHRHFRFIHQDDGKKATIESILERIKTAVFRWGVQIVVVDPYNYIARNPKADSETQWIDEMLTELRITASLYGLHIFFVAHPTKMQMDADGGYQVPKGYSISGSAAWFSKPDFGLTVHRVPNTGSVKIVNWKTRYDWLGKVGEATILYDDVAHVYLSDNFTDQVPYGED